MPIIFDDELLSLQEAARLLPRRRGGKPTHPATIARWGGEGLSGVKLELLRVGNSLFTTRDALQRFFDELTKRETETNER